jgi:hypothetical protein
MGNDFPISLIGTSDSMTVENSDAGTSNQTETFTTLGGLRLDTQIAQLVSALATYSANNSGFNPATATQTPNDANVQPAIGASWHNIANTSMS